MIPSSRHLDESDGLNLKAAQGSLLGTLVGDSLGLPYEGLAARRGTRLLPFPLRQRLFLGRGFPSDDTVQSWLVCHAILLSEGSEAQFRKNLARFLRIWFLSAPPGIGLSTLKSCLRLCLGIDPSRSGVYSAGNGAAMRSAVIGALYCNDQAMRVRTVEVSTAITHTDPLALDGAQAISPPGGRKPARVASHIAVRSPPIASSLLTGGILSGRKVTYTWLANGVQDVQARYD